MSFLPSKLESLFTILSYVLPVFILSIIWVPPISHYYVPSVLITDHVLDAARYQPDNSAIDEIRRFFQPPENKTNKQLNAEAEQIMQGKLDLSGFPSTSFTFPFNPLDLDKNGSKWQLFFASLAIPERLLNSYQVTGNIEFLLGAKEIISEFARYERNSWLPKGFLWNDHAIAGRIPVMAKFWKLYRNHPDYQFEVARDLFQLAARSAKLLVKPAHFTFATNHGVMQNLALLQICLAFPTLPNVDYYKHVALGRLCDQMHFYVNDEGVVLEHSAGYQKVGLKFMGIAFRYLTLLEMTIPEDWKVKYQKAEAFYSQLLRPDGSLPIYGDTDNGRKNHRMFSINFDANGKSERLVGKEKWIPKQPHSLYPVAGYSIWWNGFDESPNEKQSNQTVVAWSYFPGHAHKHADEMSVLLWAKGHNWWTNVGYWPYGTKGRAKAVSWAGSNAPHLINESTNSRRQTRLLSYGWSDSLAAIDLEREGPNEYVARRQVLHVKPNLWIVLDHTFGNKDQRTTTTWTTSSRVNLSKGELPISHILETEDSNERLTKFILTSKGAKISRFKGSFSPFAGWDGHRPASAVIVEQPANDSWAAAIWLLQKQDEKSQTFSGTPDMKYWKNPENWRIGLPLASGLMSTWREDDRIFVRKDARKAGIQKELLLSKPPQITNELAEIYTAYKNTAMKYSLKRYSMHRRLRATYFIIILFLVQEAFFLIYRRHCSKYCTILRGMSAFGWIAVGAWLFTVYL
jgi:Heparinase II/III N-terminus/Heparinase II/III-like protein